MPESFQEGLPEVQKEALKFLERDFNQCFQQMRHYDAQIFDIIKFMFTTYAALFGIALGLYQYQVQGRASLSLPIIVVLGVGLVTGMFLFGLALRNRVYYVKVARYINEQRDLFFKHAPFGFSNTSGMYTSPTQPSYLNLRSSHGWFASVLAFLNSTLAGILLYVVTFHLGAPDPSKWNVHVLAFYAGVALFALQGVWQYLVLWRKDRGNGR